MNTLDQLSIDEFKRFKWHLQQPEYVEGLRPLTKSALEHAERTDTVDLIVQSYAGREAQIMLKVLNQIKRVDLAKSFETGPTGR